MWDIRIDDPVWRINNPLVRIDSASAADRAGDISTPAEIAYLRRRDKIHAWLRARRERERFKRWTKLEDVITMTLRGPGAADPRDAAGKVRGPVEKSDLVLKPKGVPTTEDPKSLLAEALEKDISPAPKRLPSPKPVRRVPKAQPKRNVVHSLKSYLDIDAQSNAKALGAVAAFAAEHNQAHAQARQLLAAFR